MIIVVIGFRYNPGVFSRMFEEDEDLKIRMRRENKKLHKQNPTHKKPRKKEILDDEEWHVTGGGAAEVEKSTLEGGAMDVDASGDVSKVESQSVLEAPKEQEKTLGLKEKFLFYEFTKKETDWISKMAKQSRTVATHALRKLIADSYGL